MSFYWTLRSKFCVLKQFFSIYLKEIFSKLLESLGVFIPLTPSGLKWEKSTHPNKHIRFLIALLKRNWVFATNSVFVKPISLQPYDVNLWYFKLTLFDLRAFIVWNIKGLRHWGCDKNSIPLHLKFTFKDDLGFHYLKGTVNVVLSEPSF